MKWFGMVGFNTTRPLEEDSDIMIHDVVERPYYGEETRLQSQWKTSGHKNDDKDINTEISIVSDPFACDHFTDIIYVEFMGVKWDVTSVSVQYPRLILSVGGIYND